MPRIIPGKITREAPEGPTMTEAQFRLVLQQQADNATRWRWAIRNWQQFEEIVRNSENGPDMQFEVDTLRRAEVSQPR